MSAGSFILAGVWIALQIQRCCPTPWVVCRGWGDPFSVREANSWIDFAPRVDIGLSCHDFCQNLNPRYSCLEACRPSSRSNTSGLPPTQESNFLCDCKKFEEKFCPDVAGNSICRCGTPNALERRQTTAVGRDFDTVEFTMSVRSDSDGFDVGAPTEPQIPGGVDSNENINAHQFPGYFQVLSNSPRIYYYPNFLSSQEVDEALVEVSHCLG